MKFVSRAKTFVVAAMALSFSNTVSAQDASGAFQLPSGGFGVLSTGMPQSAPSNALTQARDLGKFEDTVDMRAGWFLDFARITGRLDIEKDRKDDRGEWVSYACTATAISDSLILTNAHCFIGSAATKTKSLQFHPNYRDARKGGAVARHEVMVTPEELGDQNDFDYAIFRLKQPIANYQAPRFVTREVVAGEPLVVIGHPEAEPLLLSRGGCQSDPEVPTRGNDLLHRCSTRQGSSGSLVFSLEGDILGLHHLGGEQLSKRRVNRAVQMTKLVEQSDMLRAIFQRAQAGDKQAIRIDRKPNTKGTEGMCLLGFDPGTDVLNAINGLDHWKQARMFIDPVSDAASFVSMRSVGDGYKEVHWGNFGQAFGSKYIKLNDNNIKSRARILGDEIGDFRKYLPANSIHRLFPIAAVVKENGRVWQVITLLQASTAATQIKALKRVGFLGSRLRDVSCIDVDEVNYLVDATANIQIDLGAYLKLVQVAQAPTITLSNDEDI